MRGRARRRLAGRLLRRLVRTEGAPPGGSLFGGRKEPGGAEPLRPAIPAPGPPSPDPAAALPAPAAAAPATPAADAPAARGARSRPSALAAVLLAAGLGACDDQVKYVPWFSTMTEQPSIETYEAQPLPPPEGAVHIGRRATYDLAAADTTLRSPLEPAPEVVARGKAAFARYCLPCHGEDGAGTGPVMSTAQHPNRLPPLPTANLLSQRARDLSDGYVWGMIENGRGLMPDYRRVPLEERWEIVAYIRELQRLSPPEQAGAPGGGGR